MSDAFAIARLGLLTDLERLDTYGQNVANATTLGYRRQLPITGDFLSRFRSSSIDTYASAGSTIATTDLHSGALQATSRSLDIALDGDGFLKVDTQDGPRYTRRGDLRLDASGNLVTATGHALSGLAGGVRLKAENVTIASNGEIRSGDDLLGRLNIVDISDPNALIYEGDGLFKLSGQATAQPTRETRVRQGYLEASNVQPLKEMIAMMETSRHFEITKNVMTAYDSMLDTAINSIGTF